MDDVPATETEEEISWQRFRVRFKETLRAEDMRIGVNIMVERQSP